MINGSPIVSRAKACPSPHQAPSRTAPRVSLPSAATSEVVATRWSGSDAWRIPSTNATPRATSTGAPSSSPVSQASNSSSGRKPATLRLSLSKVRGRRTEQLEARCIPCSPQGCLHRLRARPKELDNDTAAIRQLAHSGQYVAARVQRPPQDRHHVGRVGPPGDDVEGADDVIG